MLQFGRKIALKKVITRASPGRFLVVSFKSASLYSGLGNQLLYDFGLRTGTEVGFYKGTDSYNTIRVHTCFHVASLVTIINNF